MRVFKRIVASLSSFVITFMAFAVPAAPIAKAGVIEDAAYVYTQYNLVQQMLHYVFVAIGAGSGAVIGSIALPGVGTVAGTTVGTFIGDFLEAGVKDIASYYAAGYTDEDFEEVYLASLSENGFGEPSGRIPVSSDFFEVGLDFTCASFGSSSLVDVYTCFYNLVSTDPVAFTELLRSLGFLNKGGYVLVFGISSDMLLGLNWSEPGRLFLSCWENPLGKADPSLFGVHAMDSLSLLGYARPLWYEYGTLNDESNIHVYFNESMGLISPLNTVRTCLAPDSVFGYDGNPCRINLLYKYSDKTSYTERRTLDFLGMDLTTVSGTMGTSFYCVDSAAVAWQFSSDISNDRFGTYMEALDEYNKVNSYRFDPYVSNYFITPDGGDTLYSPAIFSESSMIFTEPVTGTQYPCSKWVYHYTEDNVLTYEGIPIEGNYLGSYILTLTNPVTVNGFSCLNYWIVYMDESVYIAPFYSVDGTVYFPAYHQYSYVTVAQTSCGLGDHDMTWEITQPPTCTSTGTEVGTCSICGKSSTYELDKLEHTYKSSVTQQATCTGTGIMTYTCTACGNEYTETIAATGVHSYNYSLTTAPTCTTEGTALYTCSVCGNQYAETVPAISHKEQIIAFVETVYDEDGYVVTAGYTVYECTTCGQQRREVDDVAGTGDDLLGGLGGAITSFAKRAWLAISSGLGKLFSGFADLLGGIFGFFTDAVIGGVKSFFGTLSDDSILGYYQDDTGTAALPEGVGSAMAMIPAFFGGLPAELQAPVIFGIAALFLIAALKLFL